MASEPQLLRVHAYADERARLPEEVFLMRFPMSVIIAHHEPVVRGAEPDTDVTRRPNSRTEPPRETARRVTASSPLYLITKEPDRPFPDRVGVGRARGTDIWLPYEDISKYHGFFTLEARVAVSVTDAGSMNGTFVAGERIAARVEVSIHDGDEIAFGPHSFVFHTASGFAKLLDGLLSLRRPTFASRDRDSG